MLQALEGYGASCKRISRAGEEEDCNKDPSASLGMTVLGEWIDSQGGKACMEAASPLFLLGRCPEVAFKSPVTPTIRGKVSSHMRGMRSFGSVPTCSGWGFSHIERFRPLRMTIREGGWAHRLAVLPTF